MNKLYKRDVFQYLVLNLIYLVGVMILPFYFSGYFIRNEFDSIFIVSFIAISAFNTIFVIPKIANYLISIHQVRKLTKSLFNRLFMMIFIIIMAFLEPITNLLLFLLLAIYFLFDVLYQTDGLIHSELPFYFDKQNLFDLTKLKIIINFFNRGMQAFAPGIALVLSDFDWHHAILLSSVLILCGTVNVITLRSKVRLSRSKKKKIIESELSAYPNEKIENLSKWYNLNIFLFNTVFSTTALLLFYITNKLNLSNGIITLNTYIYTGFIVALVFMYFKPRNRLFEKHNTISLCLFFSFLISILFVLVYIFPLQYGYILLFMVGIAYGNSIILMTTYIPNLLYGKKFLKYLSNSQSYSRVGALISAFLCSLIIELDIAELQKLQVLGMLGVVSSILSYMLSKYYKV